MEEAEVVERLREEAERTGDQDFSEAASLIERQQQVIDLLMKAVEPFADEGSLMFSTWSDDEKYLGQLTVGNFRRAREAKVEAERILNHSHPGLERERE